MSKKVWSVGLQILAPDFLNLRWLPCLQIDSFDILMNIWRAIGVNVKKQIEDWSNYSTLK